VFLHLKLPPTPCAAPAARCCFAAPPRARPVFGKGTNSGSDAPSHVPYRDFDAVTSSHTTCKKHFHPAQRLRI